MNVALRVIRFAIVFCNEFSYLLLDYRHVHNHFDLEREITIFF